MCQGDTLVENVFKQLDWFKKGVNVDGKNLRRGITENCKTIA